VGGGGGGSHTTQQGEGGKVSCNAIVIGGMREREPDHARNKKIKDILILRVSLSFFHLPSDWQIWKNQNYEKPTKWKEESELKP
jgi:hypothetical protein